MAPSGAGSSVYGKGIRAEAFAGKNGVAASALDGLGMGIGFTAALFCMGIIRETLGSGTFLSGISSINGGNGLSIPFLCREA